MPKSAPPSPIKARKSAEKSERFPSRALWQDPWEGVGDLKTLRAKKAWLDAITRLAEHDPGAQQLPVVSEEALRDLVARHCQTNQHLVKFLTARPSPCPGLVSPMWQRGPGADSRQE